MLKMSDFLKEINAHDDQNQKSLPSITIGRLCRYTSKEYNFHN